ncbi:MAG: hypothetical protein C4523_04635 [Myxococcales bacterium]|nr:MAG: hypothetical protein C4523_04635 [Myxococcales bacterium]
MTDGDETPDCNPRAEANPLNYPCNLNEECESGLCLTDGLSNFCSDVCDAETAPCPDGMDCIDGGEELGMICTPTAATLPGDASVEAYKPCNVNEDCADSLCLYMGGQWSFCAVNCAENDASACGDCGECIYASEELGYVCVPVGPGEFADDCLYPFDCQERVCFNEYCTGECEITGGRGANDNCPDGMTCAEADIDYLLCFKDEELNKEFGEECAYDFECASGVCFTLDFEDPATCNLDCSLDGALCPDTFACANLGTEENPFTRCIPADQTDRPFGAECEYNYNCASGACVDGFCNQSCTFNARSANDSCPDDYTCIFISGGFHCIETAQIGVQGEDDPCAKNYECATGLCQNYAEQTVDTKITLYGSDGATMLGEDDDGSGVGLYSKLEYTFAEAGTYFLKVEGYYSDFSGYSIGYYFLSLNDDGLTEDSAEVEPNDDTATAETVTPPVTVFAYLGEADQDWFQVTVEAAAVVAFETHPANKGVCEAAPACVADLNVGDSTALPYSGAHAIDGEDFDFGSNCTGYGTTGPDFMFDIYLAKDETVRVVATPDTDADLSIYVAADCIQCMTGVDAYYGNTFEALTATAPYSGVYHVIIDNDGTVPTTPDFTLDIELNPANECGAINADIGCCAGESTLARCDEPSGLVHTFACTGDYPVCGWDDLSGAYVCTTAASEDPSGDNPRMCPAP